MEQRLQKLISVRGVASRREAENLIRAGRVTVDDQPAQLGQSADPERQVVCVDGRPLPAPGDKVYIMLNKPVGYVTTVRDDKGRKTVMDLLGDRGDGLWPVGRLDLNSQGLLLLTNDGALTNRLTHPSYEVEKTYRVYVRGEDMAGAARAMGAPMELDGYAIRPAQVRLLKDEGGRGLLQVTIREGKNRQVRRMCALCGLTVTRLIRVGEGKLRLGDLRTGKWRPLTGEEIDYLKSI